MKKKLLLAVILCIPFISIILVILFRTTAEPSNEEIIKSLKETSCYSTKVDYITKNSKGDQTEQTMQYYKLEKGARIEFNKDRVKIFKDNKVLVKDNISNKDYVVEEDLDKVHSIAFMKNLLSNPIISDSIKEGQEEWGDTEYIEFTTELFLDNDHLDKARVFIDKKDQVPIGVIIYNKSGKDTMRIVYRDFQKLKDIEESLI